MDFRLQQKSLTMIYTLNVNSLIWLQCYVYYDETAEVRIRRFSL